MRKLGIVIFSIMLSSCSAYRYIVGEKDLSDKTLITVSYYGGRDGFHGKKTANGEIFDENELTAAHRDLPFGSKLYLFNPKNRRHVCVRINDRGPYLYSRDLDISLNAARELGIIRDGVCEIYGKLEDVC